MYKKLIYLFSVVLLLSLVSTSYGQVVIGNWENVMDGWVIDPCAPPGTTTSYSATGVTLNSNSLKVTVPVGDWNQAIRIPLDDEGLTDEFFDNDVFSLDITQIASEWTIIDPCDPNLGWSDIQVIINADSDSGPVWIELGADASQWNYAQGDSSRSCKWGYSGAKAQIDKDTVSTLDIIIVSNYDPNYTSGGVYYFDKARLESLSYLSVIGNFENVMDGWVPGWQGDPVLVFASTGVTLDDMSLSVDINDGYWCLSFNAPAVPVNLGGVTLTFDLTMIASEWPSQPWTKVGDKIALNSDGPDGWKEYSNLATVIDRNTGNPSSLDWGAWSGDAYRTYSLDISNYNITGATFFQISISMQGGEYAGSFYFDNVRLTSAGPAYNPKPANNQRKLDTDVNISWTPGLYADKHDVYFGTNKTKVDTADRSNPMGVLCEQDYGPNSYDPGELEIGKTYHWRIDEVNQAGPDPGLWKGNIWTFTTEYAPPGIVIGDWEDNMDGWLPHTGDPVLSYSTTGATLNDKSLKIEVGGDDWNWVILLPFTPEHLEYLKANDIISLDVTWVTSEWQGGAWAQVPSIAINAEGIGWNQVDPPTSDTSNPGSPGDWDPFDFGEIDTRTITWNYGDADINDVADIPEGGYCFLQIATQHDPSFGTGTYYFDNLRFLNSRVASNPEPADRETDVKTNPTLKWKSGSKAVKHDIYFGTDYDIVNDANRTSDPYSIRIKTNYDFNNIDIAGEVGILSFDTIYYWKIDEVNGTEIWPGSPWRFTTGHFLVVDDFESYNPNLTGTWTTSGNAAVSISTDRIHGGTQAMAYFYDNNDPPYYSEAYANTVGPNNLETDNDWTAQGVKALSLWFHGVPDLDGSFTEASGVYTIEADGRDIFGTSDGLHYGYKMVNILENLPASITARVFSVENTDPWAKAGVMFRSYLDPDSTNVAVVLTPGNGVSFQHRDIKGDETLDEETIDGNVAPHWVRLTFGFFGDAYSFRAEHAEDNDGTPGTWLQIGEDLPITALPADLYIGLCATSHTDRDMCTAVIDHVTMTGSISGDWQSQDIGIISNDPESMYVILQDGDSNAIVYHDDPNVTQTLDWTEWRIDLNDFTDVNLANVQRMYIGFGDWGVPTQSGSGTVYIDDIRLYPADCYLAELPDWPAHVDLVPDCSIDYLDLDVLVDSWLQSDPANNLYGDDTIDFSDIAELAKYWGEQEDLWPSW